MILPGVVASQQPLLIPSVVSFEWNPADASAGVTVSGGDLTATTVSGTGYRGVRGIGPFTSGIHHVVMNVGTRASNFSFGVANISGFLDNFGGVNNDSVGYYQNGQVFYASGVADNTGIYTVASGNNSPEMEFDAGSKTVRFRNSSGGSYGISINIAAMIGAIYLFWSTDTTGNDITIVPPP